MANRRTTYDRLSKATDEELIEELARRRRYSLTQCSYEEVEAELERRRRQQFPDTELADHPPKIVEK